MSAALTTAQSQFQERVKNHIKDTFVSLIPEEEFARMVDAEIKAFFENTVDYTWEAAGYRDTEKLKISMTPFRQMVWSKVKPIVEAELQNWFAGPQEAQFREFVKEMIGSDTLKNGTALTVQQLMVVMAGQMFYQCAAQANMQMRSDLQTIFYRAGMPGNLLAEMANFKVPGQYMPQTAPGSEPAPGSVYVNPSPG